MNSLYIDTRDNKRIIIRLDKGGEAFEEESQANIQKAQATLPIVERLLSEAGIKAQEIDEIVVEKGPGSFTGLRVGMAIANALSLALKVPVNKRKLGEQETPEY